MRQAETAIAARRAVEPTLPARQAFIREQLGHYRQRYGCWPTGLELLRFITATVATARHFDVNSARPPRGCTNWKPRATSGTA